MQWATAGSDPDSELVDRGRWTPCRVVRTSRRAPNPISSTMTNRSRGETISIPTHEASRLKLRRSPAAMWTETRLVVEAASLLQKHET